jgi:hypothetical protein
VQFEQERKQLLAAFRDNIQRRFPKDDVSFLSSVGTLFDPIGKRVLSISDRVIASAHPSLAFDDEFKVR